MTETYRNLLLGCGTSREKLLGLREDGLKWRGELVTLDNNPAVKADILENLNNIPWPMMGETYDEVHAYEVLEHLGTQGDLFSFFDTFNEIYRILKPNGYLFATTPSRFSQWAWGDPGHTRLIQPESLVFLDRGVWLKAKKAGGPASDYRHYFNGDFHVTETHDDHVRHRFCMRAVKPAREW